MSGYPTPMQRYFAGKSTEWLIVAFRRLQCGTQDRADVRFELGKRAHRGDALAASVLPKP